MAWIGLLILLLFWNNIGRKANPERLADYHFRERTAKDDFWLGIELVLSIAFLILIMLVFNFSWWLNLIIIVISLCLAFLSFAAFLKI